MSEADTWGEPDKRERLIEQLREEVNASGLLRCKARRIAQNTEFHTQTVGKYLSRFANEDAAGGVNVSVFHRSGKATIYEISVDDDEQRLVSDGGESATALGHTDTFIAEIESIDDVNDATQRVNSVLDELRKRTNGTEARIVVAEVQG